MRHPQVLLLGSALAMAPAVGFTADQQVVIDHHMFVPSTLTVHRGDKVTWVNKDTDPHSVSSDDHGRTFHSAILDPGRTFAWTFSGAGTFGYYCTVHPDMQASIVVR